VFWSFGASPFAPHQEVLRLSSTPKELEVIFCDYSFFSGIFFDCFHLSQQSKEFGKAFTPWLERRAGNPGRRIRKIWLINQYPLSEPDRPAAVTSLRGIAPQKSPTMKRMINRRFYLEIRIHHNLMMTNSEGILEKLQIPTEENAMSRVRNPQDQERESVISFSFFQDKISCHENN